MCSPSPGGKDKAFDAMELQRVLPALIALLEYEWLTDSGRRTGGIDCAIGLIKEQVALYVTVIRFLAVNK